ncbi:hypothetical protein KCH_60630 [Kitasatospora cheerisanensis KCTC 2395]|uniref:Luciferase-like domain-containing protein n=1 Tax=Kitasatospora cheerisanensis KCTC 2395 TaxID=1348663 RepID=A0A066YQI6_9ACTN|nr:hypothetical protein KCH_60630 [Kitasatospora cheerisanensis KCTC 2395]
MGPRRDQPPADRRRPPGRHTRARRRPLRHVPERRRRLRGTPLPPHPAAHPRRRLAPLPPTRRPPRPGVRRPALPLPDTRRRIAEAHAAAARHGRTLRISRHVTVVLAETDAAAHRRLRDLLQHTDAPTRRHLATAYTGTPDTVATRLHLLRAAGVQVLHLAFPTPQARALRRELITQLRNPSPPRRSW